MKIKTKQKRNDNFYRAKYERNKQIKWHIFCYSNSNQIEMSYLNPQWNLCSIHVDMKSILFNYKNCNGIIENNTNWNEVSAWKICNMPSLINFIEKEKKYTKISLVSKSINLQRKNKFSLCNIKHLKYFKPLFHNKINNIAMFIQF